ncbi:MAG TPA: helix-turn-helix transcriptional regulator [Epulopiscium sp.]|nr:helix-turn-helix transcriptional regulator [Candidatus Epulonipiscium sp.]
MKLTDKIDMLMNERGLNKMDLSRGAGIPYTTISSFYDKGTENVKLSTLKKLADFFDCSLDFIADDSVTERKNKTNRPTTIAAHLDGEDLTEEETDELNKYIDFLISRRKK